MEESVVFTFPYQTNAKLKPCHVVINTWPSISVKL